MSSIFSLASLVIALDKTLYSYKFVNGSAQETAVRILSAPWMTRLWTLQEAALAKNLAFLMNGILTDMAFIRDCVIRGTRCPILMRFGVTMNLLAMGGKKLNPAEALFAASGRASSKLGDETIAVAPMIGVDVDALLATEPEERMGKFWRTLGVIPSGVLFVGGKKLEERGLRWAPRGFGEAEILLKGGEARITMEGLKGEWFVFTFKERVKMEVGVFYGLHDCTGEDQGSCDGRLHLCLNFISHGEPRLCDALAFKESPAPGDPDLYGVALLMEDGAGEEEVFRYGGGVFAMDFRNLVVDPRRVKALVKARGEMKKICVS